MNIPSQINHLQKLFIGGQLIPSESGLFFDVADENKKNIARLSRASTRDLTLAAEAAKKAFPGWADRPASQRGRFLYHLSEAVEARSNSFIELLTSIGCTEEIARLEVKAVIDCLFHYAGWADKFSVLYRMTDRTDTSHLRVSYTGPAGVTVIILPNNARLIGLISLIAPVICGGNTCIVLASDKEGVLVSPFSETLFSCDFPSGVINLLTGYRQELIRSLAGQSTITNICFVSDDSEEKKLLLENVDLNRKKILFYAPCDYLEEDGVSPYSILDYQETKTVWHSLEHGL